MGRCICCGEDFAGGVIKDLCGMASGIVECRIEALTTPDCFVHDGDCKDLLRDIADTQDYQSLPAKSPLRPLFLPELIGDL